MKCDENKQIDQSYVSTAGRGQRMKHCNILLLLCVLFAGGIGCDIAAEVKKLGRLIARDRMQTIACSYKKHSRLTRDRTKARSLQY